MPQPINPKTPQQKMLMAVGFLLLVLILPISLAAIYRVTNYLPKATFDQLPVTPPIWPSPKPSGVDGSHTLWVYDGEYDETTQTEQIQLVIRSADAPNAMTVTSFHFNPLTNSKQPTRHTANAVCNQTECQYFFKFSSDATRSEYWQYWEITDEYINTNFVIANHSGRWEYINSSFYRPIFLTGPYRPIDQALTYYDLPVDNDLNDRDGMTFSLGSLTGVRINDGWGAAFKFEVKQGQKIHIWANEASRANYPEMGSYLHTYLYKPNGEAWLAQDTRINEVFEDPGVYYLIVSTFDNKVGDVQLIAYDIDAWEKNVMIQQFIDNDQSKVQEIDLLGSIMNFYRYGASNFGREPFTLRFTYPQLTSVSPNQPASPFRVNWVGKEAYQANDVLKARKQNYTTDLFLSRYCAYNSQNTIGEVLDYKLVAADDGKSAVMTNADETPFAPGYIYEIAGPYNWHFGTVAASGLIADINADSTVDMLDYSYLTSEFFTSNQVLQSDLDCSGEVDMVDYTIFLSELGNVAISPSPTPTPAIWPPISYVPISDPPPPQIITSSPELTPIAVTIPPISPSPLQIDEFNHWRGALEPALYVVEYADLECPFCKTLHRTLQELEAEDLGGPIRWVFGHYPLSFHPEAKPAAIAAECVDQVTNDADGYAFFGFIDQYFLFQEEQLSVAEKLPQMLDRLNFSSVAKNQIIDCYNDQATLPIVEADIARGDRLMQAYGHEETISGTPTVFLISTKGTEVIRGALPKEQLRSKIKNLL